MSKDNADEILKRIQRDLQSSDVPSDQVDELSHRIRSFSASNETENSTLERDLLRVGTDTALVEQLFANGESKQKSDSMLGKLKFAGGKLKEAGEKLDEMTGVDDKSRLDCVPQGFYVNSQRVAKIEDWLDPGEKVHYMARGKVNAKGFPRVIATNKRVLAVVPEYFGNDERSIPYREIAGVDLETGMVNQKMTLLLPGSTVPIEIRRPGKGQCRDMTSFIRKKMEEPDEIEAPVIDSPDPTEQLKNLKGLYDEGVLTEDEFETKKRELLDQI